MQTNTNKMVRPARLMLLWFGVQLGWGAVLGISLQARCAALNPQHPLDTYALVSIPGALAAAVTQLIAGPLSDARRRRGDRRLVFYATGAALGAIAVISFYLAPSIGSLLASYVLLQIAFNIIIGPYQAVIPDFVESSRIGVASGWMAAMQSGGNAAGAVLATLLGNTAFLGAAIALAVLAGALATCTYARTLPLQPIAGDQKLMRSTSLVDLFISRAFVYLGFYTLLGYLYFYVANILPHSFTVNATMASGICVLLFTVVGAAGAMLAARPADRFDERLVVAAGGGIVALAVALMAWAPSILVLPCAIAVAGVGWGVFLCADWAFACRILPGGALATAMAIWNIAVVGPQMLAPAITTAVLVRLGTLHVITGPRDAFALAAGEILAGAAWIWRLPGRSVGK